MPAVRFHGLVFGVVVFLLSAGVLFGWGRDLRCACMACAGVHPITIESNKAIEYTVLPRKIPDRLVLTSKA